MSALSGENGEGCASPPFSPAPGAPRASHTGRGASLPPAAATRARGGAGGGRSRLRRPRLRSAWARRGAAGGRGSAMALGSAWKQMSWLYYQYLLVTALYMLEPWERTVFNSMLVSIVGMALYTGYVFMPQHIMAILHYFEIVQ
ncbi:serine palmitoyltransferase small subunit A [Agelaius tricolor]|uniref:serine palmitoyltransferase small subunit A n=1 Tax=Agelaius tricolor TaxID=9191 RepID=UPI0039F18F0A